MNKRDVYVVYMQPCSLLLGRVCSPLEVSPARRWSDLTVDHRACYTRGVYQYVVCWVL